MQYNRAIITITGRLPKLPGKPRRYKGVAELIDYGFIHAEIELPIGVDEFPSVPYMITVDCDSTMSEIRDGKCPLIIVTEWESMQHYYM